MNHMRRTLVIDTSIARSAGTTENPISKACRDFLEEVSSVGHCISVNSSLVVEWQRHRSGFSLQWLGSMQRRGKVNFVRCEESRIKDLSKCVNSTDLITEKQKDAVRKDFLLLHCAWASDELIASMDEKMRNLLATLSGELPAIGSVVWVNPVRAEDAALGWVKSGARTEESRKLRNWVSL